jgi:hypothetical protein
MGDRQDGKSGELLTPFGSKQSIMPGHNPQFETAPGERDATDGAGLESGCYMKEKLHIEDENYGGLGKPLTGPQGTPPWDAPEVESLPGGFKLKNG